MAHGPFQQMVDGSILSDSLADIAPTTEASMWPVADYTGIGANVLRSGQKWRVEAYGVMDTPAASQGNITLTPRWGTTTGGTALGASAATALAASATNQPWKLRYDFECRKVGIAGANTKVIGNGYFMASVALIAASTGNLVVFGSTAEVSIDSHSSGGLFMGVTVGISTDLITVMSVSMFTLN